MGRCGCIGCSRPLVLIIIERIIDKRLIKNINLHRHQVFHSSHKWREFFLPAISGNKQVHFLASSLIVCCYFVKRTTER